MMDQNSWALSENLCHMIGGLRKDIFSHTPMASAIVESSHNATWKILHTLFKQANPHKKEEIDQVITDAVANTIQAMCCMADMSLQGFVPRALAFG